MFFIFHLFICQFWSLTVSFPILFNFWKPALRFFKTSVFSGRKSYSLGITWQRVQDNRIFGWTPSATLNETHSRYTATNLCHVLQERSSSLWGTKLCVISRGIQSHAAVKKLIPGTEWESSSWISPLVWYDVAYMILLSKEVTARSLCHGSLLKFGKS